MSDFYSYEIRKVCPECNSLQWTPCPNCTPHCLDCEEPFTPEFWNSQRCVDCEERWMEENADEPEELRETDVAERVRSLKLNSAR